MRRGDVNYKGVRENIWFFVQSLTFWGMWDWVVLFIKWTASHFIMLVVVTAFREYMHIPFKLDIVSESSMWI
jgi:hypothetical protein